MSEIKNRQLPPLPQSWAWTSVGEITDVIRGASPRPKGDPRYFGGSIPWIMIADVTRQKGKYLLRTREGVTEAGAALSRRLPAGELILSNSATVCVPKILQVEGCIHDGFVTFPTLKKHTDLLFAYYWFEYVRPYIIQENRQGVTQVNLNTEIVREMHFPLAPLPEQRRIVAKVEELFSELDEGVANLKKARAQLAVYRQALLKHAFEGHLTADWRTQHAPELESADQLLARIRAERDRAFETEVEQWKEAAAQWTSSGDGERSPPKPQKLKPTHRAERPAAPVATPQSWHLFHLDEIVISIGQGWSPKCEGFPAENDHWGVMKTTAIQPLEFRGHENKQLPDGLHPRPWLQILQNDILITRAGPRSRCGIVCRVKDSPGKVMLCDKAYRLRLPEAIVSSGYMELLLNSTESSNRIEALKTGINDSGVNITQSGFLNLAFPIPPISEQIAIQRMLAESLSVIDNIEADIDLNLQKAEALRQSILKKAFAGELVPQDPADEPAAALLARIRAEREAAANAKPGKPRKAKKP